MKARSIGFGLERLGLVPIRAQRLSLAGIVLLTIAASFGLWRLESAYSLGELFRSQSPLFANYQLLKKRFPASEFDVLVVIEGANLSQRHVFEKLRILHLETQFAPAVAGVTSIFSVRDPPGRSGKSEPLIPAQLPEGKAFDALVERLLVHPLVEGRLFASRGGSGQVALFVVALDPKTIGDAGPADSVREIRSTATSIISPMGMMVRLTGLPVMRSEIEIASRRDRVLFNLAGFTAGLLVCAFFFRNVRFVAIAAVPPVVSVVWSLGAMGLLNVIFNPLMNTILPLILVVAFSDSMHMVFAIRRRLLRGDSRFEAARHAVLTVGPACALTTVTTAVALSSLAIADSALIQRFAGVAAFATLISFTSVILVVPMLTILLLRNVSNVQLQASASSFGLVAMDTGLAWLARKIRLFHKPIAISGFVLVALLGGLHLQLEPRYRISDVVPDAGETRPALRTLERRFGGVMPLQVLIAWPNDRAATSPGVVQVISDVQEVLERHPQVSNVVSLATLQHWFEGSEAAHQTTFTAYLQRQPSALLTRLISSDERSALVNGFVRDLDANEIKTIVSELELELDALRRNHPDMDITLTGLSVLSALMAVDVMSQLNTGLLMAVLLIIALVGLAFRSFDVVVVSMVPNLLAIVAAGTLMLILDWGLQYAGIVALTVAFGLAADDTIHFLNRFGLERERTRSIDEAIAGAVVRIGPVLGLTTIVLVLGIAATGFSDLPPNRLFGWLCIATLVAALVGDLVFLPAMILSSSALRSAMRRRFAHGATKPMSRNKLRVSSDCRRPPGSN